MNLLMLSAWVVALAGWIAVAIDQGFTTAGGYEKYGAPLWLPLVLGIVLKFVALVSPVLPQVGKLTKRRRPHPPEPGALLHQPPGPMHG